MDTFQVANLNGHIVVGLGHVENGKIVWSSKKRMDEEVLAAAAGYIMQPCCKFEYTYLGRRYELKTMKVAGKR
jgi:hypothetical protein